MNENKVWLNLHSIPKEGRDPKYSVGDKVRITKKKTTFETGYTPRWTEEVFTIDEVLHTDPHTYKIRDYNDERIQGSCLRTSVTKDKVKIFIESRR